MGHLKPSQLTSGQGHEARGNNISWEKRSGTTRAGRMPAATSETRRRCSRGRGRRRLVEEVVGDVDQTNARRMSP